MNYYTLGRTGLKVSRLALGTMTFGDDWGWGADETISRQIFDKYIEAGGNFIDTADLYTNGNSERLLGKFIKDTNTRDKLIITTKFTYNAEPGNPNAGGNGRKNIIRAVEGSLKRLKTDYIDLYMLHSWDKLTPAEEVMRTFDDLVSSGKIRYVGMSNVPAWYAARAQSIAEARGYEKISTLQMEYSLVERNIEHEFISLGNELGMGLMAWSPLASGLLSGKYKPSKGDSFETINGEGRLKKVMDSGNPAFEKFTHRNFKITAELEKVAEKLNRSMAQVALNWIVNQPGVSSVLIGATNLKQLEDNLGALDFQIPEDLSQKLDEISRPDNPFPYLFFTDSFQAMITGGAVVGDKPETYYKPVLIKNS